jgi:adenosylmethionine-8-amino-7-oxononanoate aminotransferase
LSVGYHAGRRAIYEPVLATNVAHVSPCYPYRDMKPGESNDEYVARLAQELDDTFQSLGPDTVCAFIAETVAGLVRRRPLSFSSPPQFLSSAFEPLTVVFS